MTLHTRVGISLITLALSLRLFAGLRGSFIVLTLILTTWSGAVRYKGTQYPSAKYSPAWLLATYFGKISDQMTHADTTIHFRLSTI